MEDKIERLKKLLTQCGMEVALSGGDIKDYEIAFQGAINNIYPDADDWWKVCSLNIYMELFNGKTPAEVINEIITNIQESSKTSDVVSAEKEEAEESVDFDSSADYTSLFKNLEEDKLTEEPDEYGLPTDDEVDKKHEWEFDNIRHKIDKEKKINQTLHDIISKYLSADGVWTYQPTIKIPDAVRKNIKSIIIPNNIRKIGDGVFRGCTSLTSVVIPNNIKTIEDNAFCECHSLTSIAIPNSVTFIGEWAFRGCYSLTSIAIPNSVTSISYGTFDGCSSLTSVNIPSSVTYIGRWVFNNCTSLKSIIIPNSVKKMDAQIFNNCPSLKTIYCETESKDSTWYGTEWWLGDCNAKVIWGYKGNDKANESLEIKEQDESLKKSKLTESTDEKSELDKPYLLQELIRDNYNPYSLKADAEGFLPFEVLRKRAKDNSSGKYIFITQMSDEAIEKAVNSLNNSHYLFKSIPGTLHDTYYFKLEESIKKYNTISAIFNEHRDEIFDFINKGDENSAKKLIDDLLRQFIAQTSDDKQRAKAAQAINAFAKASGNKLFSLLTTYLTNINTTGRRGDEVEGYDRNKNECVVKKHITKKYSEIEEKLHR